MKVSIKDFFSKCDQIRTEIVFFCSISMDKSFLTQQKNWQLMSLKLPKREPFKTQQKQQVIWLEIRLQRRLKILLQRIVAKIQKYRRPRNYQNQEVDQTNYTYTRKAKNLIFLQCKYE